MPAMELSAPDMASLDHHQAMDATQWRPEDLRAPAEQDTWLISFIDILMLLLTLFVLLLIAQPESTSMPQNTPPAPILAPVVPLPEPVIQQTVSTPPETSLGPDAMTSGDHRIAIDTPAPVAMNVDKASPVEGFLPLQLGPLTLGNPDDTHSSHAMAWFTEDFSVSSDEHEVLVENPVALLETDTPEPQASQPGDEREQYFEPHDIAAEESASVPVPGPLPLQPRESATLPDPVASLLAQFPMDRLQDRIEVQHNHQGISLEIRDDVLFSPASAELTREGIQLLDELAATLAVLPYTLSIEGHTDNRPIATDRYPSNWELSSARATVVTRHLQERGIEAQRMRAVGYADTRPKTDNDSAENRARNRRVSFLLQLPATTNGSGMD